VCGGSRNAPANRPPAGPRQSYLRITYFSPLGSRDGLAHDLIFERPGLDLAFALRNNVTGPPPFCSGGRRPARRRSSCRTAPGRPVSGVRGGLLQCGVCGAGAKFPHLCLPRIPDAIGWHADCACGGGGGRGLVDAGTRRSGGYRVRLEWARMTVSVVCAGRIGRIGRRDGRAALAAGLSAAAPIGFAMRFERQATIVRAIGRLRVWAHRRACGRALRTGRITTVAALAPCLLRGTAHRRAGNRCGATGLGRRLLDAGELVPPVYLVMTRGSLASAARGFAVSFLPDLSLAPHRYRYRLSRGPGVPR
jgi:hypothetical protein